MNKNKSIFRAIFLLLLLVGFGSLGYVIIEKWTFNDALYMAVITISTVGFKEVSELSELGRYFTILFIFFGLGIVAFLGSEIARLIVGTEIRSIIGGSRMQEKINKLKDHYIICGYGRLGSAIASKLQEDGFNFVVIEKDQTLAIQAEKDGHYIIHGNATSDEALKNAGIQRAIGIVAGLNGDSDNLFISLAARELNKKILIFSRNEEPGVEQRILRAGADVVVSPLSLSGKHIAEMITQKNKVPIPESLNEKLPSLLGFSLRLFKHPEDTVLTVAEALKLSNALSAIAIKRKSGEIIHTPEANAILSNEDALIILVQ